MSLQDIANRAKSKQNTTLLEDIICSASEKLNDAFSGLEDLLDEDASDSVWATIDKLPDGPVKQELEEQVGRLYKLVNGELKEADDDLSAIAEEVSWDSNSVDTWKDVVMAALPAGASAAMANDVEAALENIKSVY